MMRNMQPKLLIPILSLAVVVGLAVLIPCMAPAGEVSSTYHYKVLTPIRHGNLAVFPVVVAVSHDTQGFLTLDEGLRSGEVVVSESGGLTPLVRPRHGAIPQPSRGGGAQVNQLVLVNNSKRPLILLAGEIVTGGKQDRVIGKDRLVPAESDPIDLGVFCVEPGRWTGPKMSFDTMGATMAAPAVRAKAMVDKNQQEVWSEVRNSQARIAAQMPTPAAAGAVSGTSSYAKVMQNEEVKERVDSVAVPIQRDYQSLIKQLRDRNAVGVVVAVNGEIIWADIFASTSLLEKYWPKLVRSYAAEAIVSRVRNQEADIKAAQQFLEDMEGRKETVETEPGLYRHTEITGDSFKAFELTSLLPRTGFDLHVAKMAE
jgi:ARG and Rhodanese-Phosphatase-superfamily-associated Protein domain